MISVDDYFNKDYIIRMIQEKEPCDFYDEYLLGQDIWYFKKQAILNPSQHYDDFKRYMSKNLNIHFHNISIIGSAKTRFSFSPSKNFSEFRDYNDENPSDLDVVLVSQTLFDDTWTAFREISNQKLIRNYSQKTSEIFRQFISIKDSDERYENEHIKDWLKKVMSLKAEMQTRFQIYLDINYRIYKNWEAVEEYHIKGIEKLKNQVIETK